MKIAKNQGKESIAAVFVALVAFFLSLLYSGIFIPMLVLSFSFAIAQLPVAEPEKGDDVDVMLIFNGMHFVAFWIVFFRMYESIYYFWTHASYKTIVLLAGIAIMMTTSFILTINASHDRSRESEKTWIVRAILLMIIISYGIVSIIE